MRRVLVCARNCSGTHHHLRTDGLGSRTEDGGFAGGVVDFSLPGCRTGVPWADLADANIRARVWLAHHPFRGFWNLAGGLDSNSEPTNTVDFSAVGGTP